MSTVDANRFQTECNSLTETCRIVGHRGSLDLNPMDRRIRGKLMEHVFRGIPPAHETATQPTKKSWKRYRQEILVFCSMRTANSLKTKDLGYDDFRRPEYRI